jgi:hypothetical protein
MYAETVRRLDESSEGLRITAKAIEMDQNQGRHGRNTAEEWNAIGHIKRAAEFTYSAARWLERFDEAHG